MSSSFFPRAVSFPLHSSTWIQNRDKFETLRLTFVSFVNQANPLMTISLRLTIRSIRFLKQDSFLLEKLSIPIDDVVLIFSNFHDTRLPPRFYLRYKQIRDLFYLQAIIQNRSLNFRLLLSYKFPLFESLLDRYCCNFW